MMINEELPCVTVRSTITTEMDAEFDKWFIWDLLEVMYDDSDAGLLFIEASKKVDARVLHEMLVFLLKRFPKYRKQVISLGRKVAEKCFGIKKPVHANTPIRYLPEEQRLQREAERDIKAQAKLERQKRVEANRKARERKGHRCVIDGVSTCRAAPEIQLRYIDVIKQFPTMSSKKHYNEYIKLYGHADLHRGAIDNITKRMKEHGLI